jgi:uncharacterized protein YkwD
VVPALLRRFAVAAAAVAASALLPASATAACPGAGPPAGDDAAAATLCLVNAERTSRGLAPVSTDAKLGAAASALAKDMVARRFFDHTSPDGGTLSSRLRAAAWLPASGAWSAGENIAWGSGSLGTPERIVASWMASPGHRANILRASFDEIGVGIAAGAPQAGVTGAAATYVTDFGSRSAADARPATTATPTRPAACARAAKRSKKRTARRSQRLVRRCVRR